jgi:hypothetical protein
VRVLAFALVVGLSLAGVVISAPAVSAASCPSGWTGTVVPTPVGDVYVCCKLTSNPKVCYRILPPQ